MASLIRNPFGQPIMMRRAYGDALVALGHARKDVVVLSADVSSSDYSNMFEQSFPDRFFNVGIAEPALVDAAVGLANSGLVPIVNTFAFLIATRALEMVRTHLCYGQANVKLAGAYAGLSDSFDGPTHHSITDIAIFRSLPRMTIVVPADSLSVTKLLPQIAAWEGPVYLRLCRNEVPQIHTDDCDPQIGKGITLVDGDDATIIACGVLVARSLQAAEVLRHEGISTRVVDMHTIKPLDVELVESCARETGAIVTAEEHTIVGGLGGAIAECLADVCPVPVERVGLDDTFAECGPYLDLLDKYGMSVEAIVGAVRRILNRKSASRKLENHSEATQNA
ncbi:transketolase family protein [Granulicella sp. S156]|uniref:transketolase family protein n=1 Tax=Granulicella sp. S156 TaxID=1747224 RepID=UPI00131B48D8|nr:transketolase C-terminal domain-containing protein [Granulicella sp. S156]